jgi:thiosulfate reductase cytochrome b subunit
MHAIKSYSQSVAIRGLFTFEWLLGGLMQWRRWIPFAAASLVVGFLIGYFLLGHA